MLTDAYIAGFFDGEGSILFYKHKDKRGFEYPEFRLFFTSCDKDVLDEIQKHFNCGKIRETGNHKNGHSHCFRLSFERKADMLSILKQLYPYIRIKKDQCANAINFLEKHPLGWG